ncbi:MAG: hypothetical protein ACUVQX_00310 [Candidatus Bathycorpusculaceae bacterium]
MKIIVGFVSCKPVKASFGKYFGVGIRYGVNGSWAYTTSFGNAVEIIPKKLQPHHSSEKLVLTRAQKSYIATVERLGYCEENREWSSTFLSLAAC